MPYVNLNQLKEVQVFPGFQGRIVHSQSMALVYWRIDGGADLPEHSHSHEQVVNMLEGEFLITIEGETRALRPGDVAVIPPEAPHSGRALTDCRILDVFHPTREDYR